MVFFGVSGFVGMPHFRCMAKLLGYQVNLAEEIQLHISVFDKNFINLFALTIVKYLKNYFYNDFCNRASPW
jgi:hypothetical protein